MAGALAGRQTKGLGIRSRSGQLPARRMSDRSCWIVLAAAMLASAALILALNCGTTFFVDEIAWLYDTPDLDLGGVFEPYGGHLLATTRLAYAAILHTLGPEYLAFRILGVVALLLCAGLIFELMRSRIGALPALAPTLVLLFFGSAWDYVVTPLGFSTLLSIAAGLGALLALDRGDRLGDVGACALITLSVASFSTGLAFLIGVAVAVLIQADRRQRAWVFVVPSLLYAGWWLTTASSDDQSAQVTASNVLLMPSYTFEALAATLAALTGLNPDLVSGEGLSAVIPAEWGRVLAVVGIAALALRFRAGYVPRSLWVSLAIAVAFWTAGGLALSPIRPPNATRYAFMGAVVTLLVATDALRGVRLSRFVVVALFVACAFSVATNSALLRDAGAKFRSYSAHVRAKLAIAELARDRVDPQLNPLQGVGELYFLTEPVTSYLAVVDRFGSPAFSLQELKRQSSEVRASADETLVRAYDVGPHPDGAVGPKGQCDRHRPPAPGEAVEVMLPSGGAFLRTQGTAPARLLLGRFAPDPTVEAGTLAPGRRTLLRIPVDESPDQWRARVVGARNVEICPAGPLASPEGA